MCHEKSIIANNPIKNLAMRLNLSFFKDWEGFQRFKRRIVKDYLENKGVK